MVSQAKLPKHPLPSKSRLAAAQLPEDRLVPGDGGSCIGITTPMGKSAGHLGEHLVVAMIAEFILTQPVPHLSPEPHAG